VQFNPETFFESIPKDLQANKDFRIKLHTYLEQHPEDQEKFIQLLFLDPKIAFNACFWTEDPRKPEGLRDYPFILRPRQEEVVNKLSYCITNQKPLGINKSRDEGCTEIVCKMAALYLFQKKAYMIVGSRSGYLVDEKGDRTTLMAKIDYALETMPVWMQTYLGDIDRKEMQIRVPKFESVARGETTNDNFAAGRRGTFMFLDEFGRVEPRIAKSVRGSIRDVTGCIIYGSTHWYGENHPFNDELKKLDKRGLVVSLPWWENPAKNQGLYKSPDYNEVEIVDCEYYKRQYPNISFLQHTLQFKLSDFDKALLSSGYTGATPKFVADGCEQIPGDVRSPWHDEAEEERRGDKRDFISNVWMSPIGAQDSFFDGIILERIKGEFIQPQTYEGELDFQYNSEGRVSSYRFIRGMGRKRLKWWGKLENFRPVQDHNYVIGCDLSYGSGNSNSVAAIYDVNLQELVGTWVCPNTPPDEFTDQVVALARWCGGVSGEALVIYETNGPGLNVHKRLLWNNHRRIYQQRTEEAKIRKRKNMYGWTSGSKPKEALLGNLALALTESLRTSSAKKCIIHDDETLHELRSYIFYESGDIGVSEEQDLTSGARARHGDRVIALGLCVLGSKYQNVGHREEVEDIPINTFKYLLETEARKQKTLKHEMRRFLY
jgi:hypothetical protein